MFSFSFKNEKGNVSFMLKTTVLVAALVSAFPASAKSNLKDTLSSFIAPSNDQSYRAVKLADMANTPSESFGINSDQIYSGEMSLVAAVLVGLKQHPDITSAIANLASQNDYLSVSKSAYYPQLSGEFTTGNFNSENRGRQMYTISVNQMVYDFGKTKATVSVQEAKLLGAQANVLKSIDNLAERIAIAIINVSRYEELHKISLSQLKGIGHIRDIAKMRVQAGIASEVDYIQAVSRYQNAQATEVMQKSLLNQWQEQLKILLGGDIANVKFVVSDSIIRDSNLFETVNYSVIPQIIIANASIQEATAEKKSVTLNQYPTISLVGEVSKAINGENPSNGKNNGTDSALMLKASSNFYQGGASQHRKNALASAEYSAKANLRSAHLEINNEILNIREVIQQSQTKIEILSERIQSSKLTKELYQEQYTLGKRSILDLLTAEQDIYSTLMDRETTRSDVYQQIIKFINVTGRSRDVYDLNGKEIQGFKVEK